MLYNEFDPSPMLKDYIQCYWTINTIGIEVSDRKEVLPDGCFDNQLFLQVKDTIIDNSIEDIANNLHISSRHLSRLYRNKFGITTKTYNNILRFIKAKDLLEAGRDFTDIIELCNYYDQAHFIKEFRKYSGNTPKQFIS